MQYTTKSVVIIGFSGLLLSGCVTWPSSSFAQMGVAPSEAPAVEASDGYGYPDYSGVEPAAGPVPAQPAAMPVAATATAYPALVDPVMAQRTAALQNEVAKLEERLQRVEKAALRLDRRMQLVERNELSRMNTSASAGDSNAPQTANADGNDEFSDAPSAIKVSARNYAGYGEGFQPVSTPITSALQAAPGTRAEAAPQTPVRLASQSAGRLPSLADPAPTSSRVPTGEEQLAIWTVRYGSDKVWPERDQLPSSRDVVGMLREGGKVTLFARGPQPNSREFRERVKALSRYLAKVTSLDSVPIAALAAPHLDGNTIEIFAAP